jgi:hypothetical protein
MTAPTITRDTPEAAIDDGRCSFDVSEPVRPSPGYAGDHEPYRACGHTPVVATWYAVKWPGIDRRPIAALCATHDRYAQRAADDARHIIGGRMYQREAI